MPTQDQTIPQTPMQESAQAAQDAAQNAVQNGAQNAAQNSGQNGNAEPVIVTEIAEFSDNLQDLIADPSWSGFVDTFLPVLLEIGRIILVVVVLLIVVSFLARYAQKGVTKALDRTNIDATLRTFLIRITKYTVWILAVPVALSILGVEATSLAAVLGAAGLAIGLGLQGALSNISAGILLLVLRPVRIGDYVALQDIAGEVKELGLFYTVVNAFENEPVHIPNQQILSDKVRNLTGNNIRRIEVPIGVAYGTDLHEAERILIDAANGVKGRSDEKDPAVYLTGFGASSIDFIVHVYCPNREFLSVRHAAIHAVNDALAKAGIEIPFPQRTLSGRVLLTRESDDD
jgi:small conductance mechanosensitive channel